MSAGATEFFVSGGTLPLSSESYIERAADRELLEALVGGHYAYVLNSRQVGKSSLCVRTMARLKERGIRPIFIDLTQIGGSNVQMQQWYAGLALEIGRAVDLIDPMLDAFESNAASGPMQRFFGAVRDVLLEKIAGPIVILIDEIDTTRSLTFETDEFFAGIRECFNRRVLDDRLNRLTFCLLGVAVPKDLVRNPATTPFNIGVRIPLRDLSLEEVLRYGPRLGPNGVRLASRVHYWTNGQPYLTQSVCQEVVAEQVADESGVDTLVGRLFFRPQSIDTNLNLADVANRVLNDPGEEGDAQAFRANLLSAYAQARRGAHLKDDEANRVAAVLKLSGLLRSDGARLSIRNRIYRRVFDLHWIQSNMPRQELLRQRESFRRGALRGVAYSALICAVVGALAVVALRSREEAIRAEAELDSALYISSMNSLRLFEDGGDTARMAEILEQLRPSPHRGIEWNLWMARLHDSAEEYTFDYSAPGKIESGVISADGRQICIRDNLAAVAVVANRADKKVLGSLAIHPDYATTVIAEKRAIVAVSDGPAPAPVTEVATGRVISNIGAPGFFVEQICTPPRTDVIAIEEERRPGHTDAMIELYDLQTGRRLLRHKCPHGVVNDVKASRNGDRLMYSEAIPSSVGVDSNRARRVIVWDTKRDREFSNFVVGDGTQILQLSASGRLLAYLDALRVARVKDLDTGRVVYSLDNGEDAPSALEIAPDDRTMACITSEGVASLRELPSGLVLETRSDLRELAPSGPGAEWVESASTVKVVDLSRRGQGWHPDRARRKGRFSLRH